MALDIDSMNVIDRRQIEALIVGPIIGAFRDELGAARANAVTSKAIEEIAKAQGKALRERAGNGDLKSFAANKGAWQAGGARETTVLRSTADRYDFDVTRCRYAEMYRDLGYADLGFTLSCGRDAAFAEGFNPEVELKRTQTIMEGAPTCDFRYRLWRP